MAKNERPPQNTFSAAFIRDVSELVYRVRLEADCPGNTARMLGKDDDGGVKLRGRASFYDALTRVYLDVLGIRPTKPNDVPMVLTEAANASLSEVTGAPV